MSGPGAVRSAEDDSVPAQGGRDCRPDPSGERNPGTAAIAQVAYTNGAPFIAFRGLSDLAGGRDGPNQARELAAGNAARAALSFLKAWEE